MRPPANPLPMLIVGGFCVILVYHFWPYLVTGLALIGVYHLWLHHRSQ